ncbi:MAG: RNA methyltransferase [Candidatus Sumerlaeia bacterium]
MSDWSGTYPVSIALVHYPTVDKAGTVTATSTTNFDIHDLARLARTYSLAQYYVVTPVPSQVTFTRRIIEHWDEGWGGQYNPTRKEAMRTIEVCRDLNEVAAHIAQARGRSPRFVMTTARRLPHRISFERLAQLVGEALAGAAGARSGAESAVEFCIVFGTGWGLHPSLIEDMDYVLEPIPGLGDDYNHLSVRAAAAIIVDRLIQGVKSSVRG